MKFKLARATALISIGIVITYLVLSDYQNCGKIESICFYALAIPAALPVYLLTHLTAWIGFQLYQYN